MNEETISKVLTGETDIAKMSRDDFVELLKCLGRMYFARVMNCVDGTAKYDKEWTALSSIFNRVAEAITQKPVGNAAKLRETLEYPKDANDKYIHIGDAVHMLNTNHEGDHEWDDVVLFFEYVGKGGGDDWLVYGEDGAAWACECEVLKQEGVNDGK